MIGSDHDSGYIDALNRGALAETARLLEPILERSPWLAQRVAAARPFADLHDLAARIETEIGALSGEDRLRLLRAHPELAPNAPLQMTQASQDEQARLSLGQPPADLRAELTELNRRYRDRHGFPFIIALHAAADLETVLARFRDSLDRDTDAEIARALGEVVSVARARLARHARDFARSIAAGDA